LQPFHHAFHQNINDAEYVLLAQRVEDDYIVIHTRNGGGNREDYQWVFDEMSTHPWYSHNTDEDYDSTYANIYFKIPEDKIKTFVALLDQGRNPSESWQKLLKELER